MHSLLLLYHICVENQHIYGVRIFCFSEFYSRNVYR